MIDCGQVQRGQTGCSRNFTSISDWICTSLSIISLYVHWHLWD